MENDGTVAFEPSGPNPHYRPPVMRWNRVEVVGVRGLEFGIIDDGGGVLTLAVRLSGGRWRPGYEPRPDSVHRLIDPDFVFAAVNDERGPAVGHELDPDGNGGCKICNRQGT